MNASDAELITMRALLREARPYVASAKGDDTETHNFVDGLLRDIDATLAQPNAKPQIVQEPLKELRECLFAILHDGLEAHEERADHAIIQADVALAQSDAGPVAWQWQEKAMPEFGWAFCRNEEERFYLAQHPSKYNLRPLYTAPPRPAQSDVEPDRITELEREIAEELDKWENSSDRLDDIVVRACADTAQQILRSRAAERSGK